MADVASNAVTGPAVNSTAWSTFSSPTSAEPGSAYVDFEPFPVPPSVPLYFQRVWDAGTVGYCYYEKFFIDPAPLASETSPNYTGAISAHAIISLR